ncbi:MAG: STAS domain-containing protein, partial [Enterobacterales bacterium]|nr:STAS domain-containing protein [Enterobacterales bacterium]
ENGTLTIQVEGRFDFSIHQSFRNAYESSSESVDRYDIDLRSATYLDSSALGMLLLLREYAGSEQSKISISNGSDDIRKILTISNFDQLFTIN